MGEKYKSNLITKSLLLKKKKKCLLSKSKFHSSKTIQEILEGKILKVDATFSRSNKCLAF